MGRGSSGMAAAAACTPSVATTGAWRRPARLRVLSFHLVAQKCSAGDATSGSRRLQRLASYFCRKYHAVPLGAILRHLQLFVGSHTQSMEQLAASATDPVVIPRPLTPGNGGNPFRGAVKLSAAAVDGAAECVAWWRDVPATPLLQGGSRRALPDIPTAHAVEKHRQWLFLERHHRRQHTRPQRRLHRDRPFQYLRRAAGGRSFAAGRYRRRQRAAGRWPFATTAIVPYGLMLPRHGPC